MQIPKELSSVLNDFDLHDLPSIIKAKDRKNFEALKKLVAFEPSVKQRHRQRAMYILGIWGDLTAVTAILNVLPNLDRKERITAIDALGKLGTKTALEGIIKYMNDTSPSVRKVVTIALGRINNDEARAVLRNIEEKDSSDYIRALATKQLSRINSR